MKCNFIPLYIGLFYAASSWGQVATETLRIRRCYALFTSKRIPSNHTLLLQVKNASKTGTQACMDLFDLAQLGSSNQVDPTNAEALLMIRKFQEIHRQFFEVKSYNTSFADGKDATPNVIDLYEGANFLTYVLLKPNTPYSHVVTAPQSYRAIRTSLNSPSRILNDVSEPLLFLQGPSKTTWTPSVLVDEGTLLGFSPDSANNVPTSLYSSYSAYVGSNVNDHKGAGILGTQAYLLANLGKEGNPNGTSISYRRWGSNLMKDFLCREMPALRASDVTAFVDTSSSLSYRKSISCNQCHATQDPIAGTIRNHIQVKTVSASSQINNVHFMASVNVDQGSASTYPLAADTNYYRRPPDGDLRYRSYDGVLINQNLSGLDDLGAKLAQTNDLYVCAAKKYYKFMTGVDINLRDIGDSLSAPLTTGEQFHRTKIISLGLNLKNHQSLRTLMQEIISSPTFVYPYKVQ